MGLCNSKRLAAALIVVWLITMMLLWFPDLMPFGSKKTVDKGVFRKEAISAKKTIELKDAVHVCITSDQHTIGGMIALINSIQQNTKHDVMFHLVVDKDSLDHARIWIETTKLKNIHYELRDFPEEWVKGKVKVRGDRQELAKPLNYARYYLPRLFPNLKGKIIFIDDDCIVQGDIKVLFDMKIRAGHWAAFSKDCAGPAKRVTLMRNNYADYLDFKNKHVKEMSMKETECAFNTGVYVTDLDLWRKNDITSKLEHWMELNTKEEVYGNEKGGGGSQPPMMIVFYNKYTEINPGWHVRFLGWTHRTSYSKAYITHAKLLHWNGRFKPWGRATPHSAVWDRYFIKDPLNKFVPVRRRRR